MEGSTAAFWADAVMLLHFAFILFVVAGGFLAWRWPALLLLHVPAVTWGAWVSITNRPCPLTPLENRLRDAAGEQGYDGGFIAHYLMPIIYPPGLTAETQWVLAAGLTVLTSIAYHVAFRRWMRRRQGARQTVAAAP